MRDNLRLDSFTDRGSWYKSNQIGGEIALSLFYEMIVEDSGDRDVVELQ